MLERENGNAGNDGKREKAGKSLLSPFSLPSAPARLNVSLFPASARFSVSRRPLQRREGLEAVGYIFWPPSS